MPEKNSTPTELVGWFWPFTDEEAKLPGALEMEADGRMKLKLINQVSSPDQVGGAFDMPFEGMTRPWYLDGNAERLAGLVSGTTVSGRSVRDEAITLDGCSCLTFGDIQQPRQILFTVNLAYIGIALPPTEELHSSKATCHAEGVEGWLNPGGPKLPEGSLRSPSVEIESIADIEGVGRTTVKLFTSRVFSRIQGNTAEVRENGHFTVSLSTPAGWNDIRDCLYSTYRFIRFALNSLCVIKQILIDADGRQVEVVERLMRDNRGQPYRPAAVRWEAMFTADQEEESVVGSASEVLQKWLQLPREARGTLLRLHGLMIGEGFLEDQAVSVCAAGELWSRQIMGYTHREESVEPLEESVKRKITEIFDANGWRAVYRNRVLPILDSPNELSTGMAVRKLFDPIEQGAMSLAPDDPCEVATKLLGLRHPLSHGDVSSSMSADEMSTIVRKARAILKLAVLAYLGVDWRTVARYNKTIRWELGLDDSWHGLPYPAPEDEDAERTITEER